MIGDAFRVVWQVIHLLKCSVLHASHYDAAKIFFLFIDASVYDHVVKVVSAGMITPSFDSTTFGPFTPLQIKNSNVSCEHMFLAEEVDTHSTDKVEVTLPFLDGRANE